MAYTQEQADALRTAIATGVLTVKQGGEEITYRSSEEMRRTLKEIESELAGKRRTARVATPRYRSGY